MPRVDDCAKLHKFSAILAWRIVLNDSLFKEFIKSHFSSYCLKYFFSFVQHA